MHILVIGSNLLVVLTLFDLILPPMDKPRREFLSKRHNPAAIGVALPTSPLDHLPVCMSISGHGEIKLFLHNREARLQHLWTIKDCYKSLFSNQDKVTYECNFIGSYSNSWKNAYNALFPMPPNPFRGVRCAASSLSASEPAGFGEDTTHKNTP